MSLPGPLRSTSSSQKFLPAFAVGSQHVITVRGDAVPGDEATGCRDTGWKWWRVPGAVGLGIGSSVLVSMGVAWFVRGSTAEVRRPGHMVNTVGMILEYIPPRDFLMGSPVRVDYAPAHRVRSTKAFYIGATEVTQAQWQEVMVENPSVFVGDNLPVERVSWYDAVKFCAVLGSREGRTYRLPSEEEWEYACRAGTRTEYNLGDTLTSVNASVGKRVGETRPVASYGPNRWGLYDMHGNVWEWCQDRYRVYPRAQSPPYGEGRQCVLRGGGWSDDPWDCGSGIRAYTYPGRGRDDVGFRVVMEVTAPATRGSGASETQ